MSELKCPFCQQEMNKSENNMFYCGTDNCSLQYIDIPKKALEEFAESYQDRLTDCKRIGNLNEELDRTRKALDVAKDTIRHTDWFFDGDYNVDAKTMHNEIKCAIKGITALEQKD